MVALLPILVAETLLQLTSPCWIYVGSPVVQIVLTMHLYQVQLEVLEGSLVEVSHDSPCLGLDSLRSLAVIMTFRSPRSAVLLEGAVNSRFGPSRGSP